MTNILPMSNQSCTKLLTPFIYHSFKFKITTAKCDHSMHKNRYYNFIQKCIIVNGFRVQLMMKLVQLQWISQLTPILFSFIFIKINIIISNHTIGSVFDEDTKLIYRRKDPSISKESSVS